MTKINKMINDDKPPLYLRMMVKYFPKFAYLLFVKLGCTIYERMLMGPKGEAVAFGCSQWHLENMMCDYVGSDFVAKDTPIRNPNKL